MATTLQYAMTELSKQIGDYWESTTTGTGSTVTVVDSALLAKPNDWITDVTYDFVTSGTNTGEERKVSTSSLLTAGTYIVGTHGTTTFSGITYQIHRLFEPSEKRRALITAAKNVYPDLYQEIWEDSLVSGNWLKDGSFETWTTSTNLSYWTETTVTTTQVSTGGYIRSGGLTSARLTTAAGSLSQGITDYADLQLLRGKNVTFTSQGWCNVGSCLRLSINDGSTQSYSEYHDGGTTWTEDNPRNDNFYVTQNIDSNATQVTFAIHHDVAAGTSYVDDARVISGRRGKTYLAYVGFAQNIPPSVYIEPNQYSTEEDWIPIHDYEIDNLGYLYIPTSIPADYRLRMRGAGYLDFIASGTSSTAWSSTIALNSPQTEVLIAEAAVYLYTWMSLPNYESGTRKDYQGMLEYWQAESQRRRSKFGMPPLSITNSWGME